MSVQRLIKTCFSPPVAGSFVQRIPVVFLIMRLTSCIATALAGALLAPLSAAIPDKNHGVAGKQLPVELAAIPKSGNSTFAQLIDHDQPGLGTFSQFYYYSTQYYGGPGLRPSSYSTQPMAAHVGLL